MNPATPASAPSAPAVPLATTYQGEGFDDPADNNQAGQAGSASAQSAAAPSGNPEGAEGNAGAKSETEEKPLGNPPETMIELILGNRAPAGSIPTLEDLGKTLDPVGKNEVAVGVLSFTLANLFLYTEGLRKKIRRLKGEIAVIGLEHDRYHLNQRIRAVRETYVSPEEAEEDRLLSTDDIFDCNHYSRGEEKLKAELEKAKLERIQCETFFTQLLDVRYGEAVTKVVGPAGDTAVTVRDGFKVVTRKSNFPHLVGLLDNAPGLREILESLKGDPRFDFNGMDMGLFPEELLAGFNYDSPPGTAGKKTGDETGEGESAGSGTSGATSTAFDKLSEDTRDRINEKLGKIKEAARSMGDKARKDMTDIVSRISSITRRLSGVVGKAVPAAFSAVKNALDEVDAEEKARAAEAASGSAKSDAQGAAAGEGKDGDDKKPGDGSESSGG